jgi:predicted small integral membrane protein
MTLRLAKTALVFAVALYSALIAFNNLSDYQTNYQFVVHVMAMDSIFENSRVMWRAITSSTWHGVLYWVIIGWETASAVLCWWGAVQLLRSVKKDSTTFRKAKDIAIAGLALNLLIWLIAFLAVGGEWFLMWQSKIWNGQEAAFRMFCVVGVVLLLLAQREAEVALP